VTNQEKLSVDIERIKDFYQDYFKKANLTCGWSSFKSAVDSYSAASDSSYQNWEKINSVLDVGAGEGHLLRYLRLKKNFVGKYVGLELLQQCCQKAIELYGKDPLFEFICDEFLNYNFGEQKFDWVVSLGSLSVKQNQQREYEKASVKKMLNLAKYGVSIYLNDQNKVDKEQIKGLEDLAMHDIPSFITLVKEECIPQEITVNHFPTEESYKTMIHLLL
jgi:SAM-dependent methyltransferase